MLFNCHYINLESSRISVTLPAVVWSLGLNCWSLVVNLPHETCTMGHTSHVPGTQAKIVPALPYVSKKMEFTDAVELDPSQAFTVCE